MSAPFFDEYEEKENIWETPRAVALIAAVIHHGLANMATNSVPAGANTVVTTAQIFENYVKDET